MDIFNLIQGRLRKRLFGFFFAHPDTHLYLREIASLLDLDPANLSRELKKWEKIGLFLSQKKGNQKHFFLNQNHPLFGEYHSVVSKTIMDWPDLLRQKRQTILKLASKYGVKNLRVFGSVARGEATNKSDLDLLADIDDDRSLLDVVGLEQDLEELLGRKVDLLTEGGVSPYLKDRIYKEARPL